MTRSKHYISVFEYESIRFKKDRRFYKEGFTKEIHEAFLSFHDQNPDTPFFNLIHDGVRFKNYVGAIQVGKTTIEVLPKAGKVGNTEAWQNVLLTMLKTCHLLQAKKSGTANLKLRANSVLELYFEMFLNEVEGLLRQGLIKKYRKNRGQQRALKGALAFNRHVSKNIVHKERFYVSYTVYTKDHVLHQILHEALLVISNLTNNSVITDKFGRIKAQFPEVKRLSINAAVFDRISESRKHQPYEEALSIAKLILLNYRPDIKAGRKNLLAIMFDMNMLWEEYVLRILKKHKPQGWEIKGQQSKLFWKRKRIRPDIIIKTPDQTYVIDTKWKIIDSNKPSDADLKQMYVYNHHWKSYQSILLYPNSGNQQSNSGLFTLPFHNDEAHSCKLGFVNVLKDSQLNAGMVDEVLDMLNVEKPD
jgi:5-methylcytosine-specific restriction enzyme subunit McrC